MKTRLDVLEQISTGLLVPASAVLLSSGFMWANIIGLVVTPIYLHLAWRSPRRYDLLVIGVIIGLGHIVGLAKWLAG